MPDFDGDDYADLVVAAPDEDYITDNTTYTQAGLAHLLSGSASRLVGNNFAYRQGANEVPGTPQSNEYFGTARMFLQSY